MDEDKISSTLNKLRVKKESKSYLNINKRIEFLSKHKQYSSDSRAKEKKI